MRHDRELAIVRLVALVHHHGDCPEPGPRLDAIGRQTTAIQVQYHTKAIIIITDDTEEVNANVK